MSLFDGIRHRISVLFRGRDYARETEQEIQLHLELASLSKTGQRHVVDTEVTARREFGNRTYYREEVRRMTPSAWFDGLFQDFTYAWRGIRRSPGFAVTVVVTIALGLGANAAMFSLLDHLLVQAPAGVVRPGEIRRLYRDMRRPKELPGDRVVFDIFRYPQLRAVLAAEDSTLQIGAMSGEDSVVVTDGTRRAFGFEALVSANYFSVLDVRPQLGRFFTKDEARIETPTPVVVISDAFWHGAFDADLTVLGRTIRLDDQTYTVVGVAPPEFSGIDLDRTDVWAPLNTFSAPSQNARPWYESAAAGFYPFARMPLREEKRFWKSQRAACCPCISWVGNLTPHPRYSPGRLCGRSVR
jgi:putative ABC transport system permease protein